MDKKITRVCLDPEFISNLDFGSWSSFNSTYKSIFYSIGILTICMLKSFEVLSNYNIGGIFNCVFSFKLVKLYNLLI